MHWNEKIDFIKKKYSDDEFAVPHVRRKEILRKIETKFIKRNKDYYDFNKSNGRFCNWYENINSKNNLQEEIELENILNPLFKSRQNNWIACEFTNHILLYEANLAATIALMSIGQTWLNTYHIIDKKFTFFVGIKFIEHKIEIKKAL